MSNFVLYNDDNLLVLDRLFLAETEFDLIYGDCIYEDKNFSWLEKSIRLLKENGIIIVQTDYHTVAEYKRYLDTRLVFVNWCIYVNEWGGTPKNRFAQKHDDILIYCNGDNWKWYGEKIQIPKTTAGTTLDKKGTGLKTPCSVFYDHVSFSTISKERVKTNDGKNIQWQKPLWLMERIVAPFTDKNDDVLDAFMGSGTLGVWCRENDRNYFGIENDQEVFVLADRRISK